MISKRIYWSLVVIVSILLMIGLAMQFTDEINWTWGDFAIAFLLFFTAVVVLEVFFKLFHKVAHRVMITIVIVLGVLLVWAELAVGIIESFYSWL